MSLETLGGMQQGGIGGMVSSEEGHLPLRDVTLDAEAGGTLYRARLRQTFVNPTSRSLELIYLFPLPADCWLKKFFATVGGRRLEGQLAGRQQARSSYSQAVEEGRFAALVERERRELFTLTLGTVAAGETIEIEMHLYGEMERRQDQLIFRFPALAAPRDLPGEALGGRPSGRGTVPDSSQVPDASRLSPPIWVAPEYPALRVSMSADLRGLNASGADVPAGFQVESPAPETYRLQLGDGRLQGDLVVRFALQQANQRTYGVHSDEHWLAELWPPPSQPSRHLRDIIFLLEAGSKSEQRLVKDALAQILADLGEQDRIGVMAFTPAALAWRPQLAAADVANLSHLQAWLAKLELGRAQNFGGSAGWAFTWLPKDRPSHVVYLGTGLHGNEETILSFVRKQDFRFHSLAIGSGSNFGFLKALGDLGRGTCHLLDSPGEVEAVARDIGSALYGPTLTQLKVSHQGEPAVGPSELFPGRSVQFCGSGRASEISVEAVDLSGQSLEMHLRLRPIANPGVVRRAWAQRRYWQLESEGCPEEAAAFALTEGILCRHTAIVLEDSERRASVAEGVLWQPMLLHPGASAPAAQAEMASAAPAAAAPAAPAASAAPPGAAKRRGLSRPGLRKGLVAGDSKPVLGRSQPRLGPPSLGGKPTLPRRRKSPLMKPAASAQPPAAETSPPHSIDATEPASVPAPASMPAPASAPPPPLEAPAGGDLFGAPAEPAAPSLGGLFGGDEVSEFALPGAGSALFGSTEGVDCAGGGLFDSAEGGLFESAEGGLFDAPAADQAQPQDLFAELEADKLPEMVPADDPFEPEPESEAVAEEALAFEMLRSTWLGAEPDPAPADESSTFESLFSLTLPARESVEPPHPLSQLSPADWARVAASFTDHDLALALADVPEALRQRLLLLLGPERKAAIEALFGWAGGRPEHETASVARRLQEALASG